MLGDGKQGGGIWLILSASAPFTSQAATAAIDDGEVKVFQHASGKKFYVMDSIEIQQSKKTRQTLSLSQTQKNVKISGDALDKMIEDNACRNHCGISHIKNWLHCSICACHPCAGAMRLVSISHMLSHAPWAGLRERYLIWCGVLEADVGGPKKGHQQ